jgi:aminoglycoside phosphotransferase (APT) family kinase protein
MAAVETVTKSRIDRRVAERIVAATWGPQAELKVLTELTGGTFNASYRLDLADGTAAVLRIAPPPEVSVMSSEHNIIYAEAEALGLVGALTGLPVAPVIALDGSCALVPSPFLVVGVLSGRSLHEVRDELDDAARDRAVHDVEAALIAVHAIKGPAFGSLAPGAQRFGQWRPAVLGMLGGVLADADAVGVTLDDGPDGHDSLRRLFGLHAPSLDAVSQPSLVHWDLWEGNVFVDPVTGEVTGIIDWERALWGDPLAEYQFRAHHERWRRESRAPDLDGEVRCLLYDAYLYGLMVVECTFRAYPEPHHGSWARGFFDTTVARLRDLADDSRPPSIVSG